LNFSFVWKLLQMIRLQGVNCVQTRGTWSPLNYYSGCNSPFVIGRNSFVSNVVNNTSGCNSPTAEILNYITGRIIETWPLSTLLTCAVTIFANIFDACYFVSKPFNFHTFAYFKDLHSCTSFYTTQNIT